MYSYHQLTMVMLTSMGCGLIQLPYYINGFTNTEMKFIKKNSYIGNSLEEIKNIRVSQSLCLSR